jgi:hypothetical protein
MPADDQKALSDYEQPRPSLEGALVLSAAAILASAFALAVIAEWLGIREWDADNTATGIILDVLAATIAGWVDARAYKTWRRRNAPAPEEPDEGRSR